MKKESSQMWDFAVTFEFDTDPPVTERGQVGAGTLQVACYRAIKAAKKARPRTKASSVVILVQKGG